MIIETAPVVAHRRVLTHRVDSGNLHRRPEGKAAIQRPSDNDISVRARSGCSKRRTALPGDEDLAVGPSRRRRALLQYACVAARVGQVRPHHHGSLVGVPAIGAVKNRDLTEPAGRGRTDLLEVG